MHEDADVENDGLSRSSTMERTKATEPPGESSLPSVGPNEDSICTEDLNRTREEVQKSLKEEQMLTSLQMQLLVQLDKLKASIATAESEERMAKLALQQAEIVRLSRKMEGILPNLDSETITIKLRS